MAITQELIVFLICFLLLAYWWSRRKFYILSWKIHTISGFPLIGIAWRLRHPNKVFKFIEIERKKMKDKMAFLWFGPFPYLYVGEPEIAKKILMSSCFQNKLKVYDVGAKHIGQGLVVSKTPLWNQRRKLFDPAFSSHILKNYVQIYNKSTNYLIAKLCKKLEQDHFYVLPYFQMCALDIACETTMGKFMKFQLNENQEIVDSYRIIMNTISNRVLNPLYHSDFIFNFTEWSKKTFKAEKIAKNFVIELLQLKIEKNKQKTDAFDDQNGNIFIDRLVKYLEEEKITLEEAVGEANVMVSAAFDVTANVISNTLMCLAMFPEYQEKVFNELLSRFPNRDNFNVQSDDLVKLTYLEMVINESMRLLAPVPFYGRSASDDFQLNDKITLPKGTQVVFDVFSIQRDESNWGSKAKLFYPEHFSLENFKEKSPFAYMPFAKGARNCIGSKYGMNAAKLILAKTLRKFYFTTQMKFEDLQYYFNVTLKFQKIPLLKIHERKL